MGSRNNLYQVYIRSRWGKEVVAGQGRQLPEAKASMWPQGRVERICFPEGMWETYTHVTERGATEGQDSPLSLVPQGLACCGDSTAESGPQARQRWDSTAADAHTSL